MADATTPTAAITVRLSNVAELRVLGEDLFWAHWEEIAKHKDAQTLDPMWGAYEGMEKAGALLCLAAFEGEKLVGYSVNMVHKHLHYAGLTVCQNDLVFVVTSHRGRGVFGRLAAETIREGRKRGARKFTLHAKKDSDLDELLRGHGYEVEDIIYSMVI